MVMLGLWAPPPPRAGIVPAPQVSELCMFGHDHIRRDIRLHYGEPQHCYAQFTVYPRVDDANIVLHVTLAPSGQVAAASADRDLDDDPRIATCIVRAARRWTFTQDTATRVVTYALHFVAR